MVKSVPGTSVKEPLRVTHTRALMAAAFAMDFLAAPVLLPVVPVTAYSVSPVAQAVPLLGDPVTVTAVVPVPFQVIVPLPDPRAEAGKEALPPVLALSEHFASVPFPEIEPESFEHEIAWSVFGTAAEAVPAIPTVTMDTGSAHRAMIETTRRIYFPFVDGYSAAAYPYVVRCKHRLLGTWPGRCGDKVPGERSVRPVQAQSQES
jgi:hypothetical protein